MNIDAVIFWRIVNPEKAAYDVDRLIDSLIDQSLNSMRSCIGACMLDEILTNRESLNAQITEKVSAIAERWGIVIQRVEIHARSPKEIRFHAREDRSSRGIKDNRFSVPGQIISSLLFHPTGQNHFGGCRLWPRREKPSIAGIMAGKRGNAIAEK